MRLLIRRVVWVVVLGSLLAIVAAYRTRVAALEQGPAPPQASNYKSVAGPFDADEADDVVLHDGKRNKDLRVKVTYPKADGKFPVIVFSHGYGGSKNTYATLTRYWAERGYVTLQPTHDDSMAQRREDGERVGILGGLQRMREDLGDPAAWENRTRDISFVIDSFAQIEKDVPGVAGKLDAGRIGVGGHSFGALTTELIGGVTATLPDQSKPVNYADHRVRALLVLSGAGPGRGGIDDRSFDHLTLPMMVMTGSHDFGMSGQNPLWRKKPYDLAHGDDRYFIMIEGAGHMTFTGMPAKDGLEPMILYATVKVASVAFWDAYLKDSDSARGYLAGSELTDFSGGKAQIERPKHP